MNQQLTLHLDRETDRIARAFRAYHEKHPSVYQDLRGLARDWRNRGGARWSINGAFEVLRWQRHGVHDPDEPWKLNNNYRALYARMLMENEPELQGIFELRERKAK